jgi:formamidopyrimidine-DNA glycosylase
MPELPEVQSFALALEKEYFGKKIAGITLHRKDLRFPFEKAKLRQVFARGSTFLRPVRVAKQLVLKTENGMVAVSLGMSGSFLPSNHPQRYKHEHVTILFEDSTALSYVDPRRFGFWKVVQSESEISSAANPLLSDELTALFESSAFRSSAVSIKTALMDQTKIGGIGNIYALEALHLIGVRPTRGCSQLKRKELTELAGVIPSVLQQAIDQGGSTISTYRRLHGDPGGFQELHRVYDRANEPCLRTGCRGRIVKIVQSGRGSWYCPVCQK